MAELRTVRKKDECYMENIREIHCDEHRIRLRLSIRKEGKVEMIGVGREWNEIDMDSYQSCLYARGI